ncbi:MAG: hypothetical protein WD491_14050 [Balneolales bacterium]
MLIIVETDIGTAQIIAQDVEPDEETQYIDQDQEQEQDNEDNRGIFGFGGMFGDPSGGTIKYWFNPANALDASAGISFRDESNENNISLHLGYLRHQYNDIDVARGLMPYYFGIGGHARFGDRSKAGVRFASGLTYLFQNDPLEIYAEFTPILELTPSTVVHINYGVGLRYYPGQLD